jgi:K+-transporting ATPase ATPase C chain
MRRQLLSGVLMTACLVVLLGFVYPLAVTGVSTLAFSHRANGSLVEQNGTVVGSSLLGQPFLDKTGRPDARYFQPRPSAAGKGYDPLASGGSNLGPSNQELLDEVTQRAEEYRSFNEVPASTQVPVDAVTASASGLDPDISVANADLQVARVARSRNLTAAEVRSLVNAHNNQPALGVLGEKTVNVLDLNIALDQLR